MKLSTQEADLFFELMWALQFFVNQRLNILPSVKTVKAYKDLPTEEKLKVRDALYKDPQLIDAFVKENPQGFSQDQLSQVSQWKNFVMGDFYIERFLKKQAIFIANDDKVYGVCGLYEGLDEMIHTSYLPLWIKGVLLPFVGKIVYDGLFQSHNIYFGSGVRKRLKETYMIAKQNDRIIFSLESAPVSKKTKAQALKSWEPEINDLYEKAKQLKAGASYPLTHGSAFGLVKASLEFAQGAVTSPKDLDALYKSLKKVERELKKAYTILDREDP